MIFLNYGEIVYDPFQIRKVIIEEEGELVVKYLYSEQFQMLMDGTPLLDVFKTVNDGPRPNME